MKGVRRKEMEYNEKKDEQNRAYLGRKDGIAKNMKMFQV